MGQHIRDDYRKFGELLDVIKEMSRPGNGISYETIMDILQCSHKTAERTVKFISERYPYAFNSVRDPMKPQRFLFRLDGADGLPPDYLTDDEILALNGAIQKIKDNTISASLGSLEYKLNRMLQRKKSVREMNDLEGVILGQGVISYPHLKVKVDKTTIEKLRNAILSNLKVSCSYMSSDGTLQNLVLSPLGVLYGGVNNYLVAYKEGKGKVPYQFILPNISDVKIIKERFNPEHFNINDYAKRSFGAFHSENGPVDIVWRVSPRAAKEAKKYEFHPTQKITENKDGSLTVKFKGDAFWEIVWYLFRWNGEIVPVAPQQLVDTYKDFITKLSKTVK